MKIYNPNKKSLYSSQRDYFKGMNPSSEEFQNKMKEGSFQRNSEEYNYKGSKEATKAKNIFK